MNAPPAILTLIDVERLGRILARAQASYFATGVQLLREKLERSPAIPAEQVPPNLVTMNSVVAYVDERTGVRSEVVMAYPNDTDPTRGRMSILSPVCASLLGLQVGQVVECPMSDGQLSPLRVVAIEYQPERAGDLHL